MKTPALHSIFRFYRNHFTILLKGETKEKFYNGNKVIYIVIINALLKIQKQPINKQNKTSYQSFGTFRSNQILFDPTNDLLPDLKSHVSKKKIAKNL